MSKTKRTLIISSFIMALAFVVAIVGVTAAWFGDMKSASRDGFIIHSDTLQDVASIDINSSKGLSGENLYPAVAQLGVLSKGGILPTGAVLKQTPLPTGVAEAAEVATVYFPIQFIGLSDKGYEAENRKSLQLQMLSANIGRMCVTAGGETSEYFRANEVEAGEDKLDRYAGRWVSLNNPVIEFDGKGSGKLDGTAFIYSVDNEKDTLTFTSGAEYTVQLIDYKDEFNIDICLVEANLNENGVFESEKSVIPTAANYAPLTGGNVFYECVGYETYMLIQPGLTYYVKAEIYFNKVDEECNPELLNTVIKFNFKLNILVDGELIRTHGYREAA